MTDGTGLTEHKQEEKLASWIVPLFLTLGFFLSFFFFSFAICQLQLNGILRWTRDAGP